MNDLVSELRLLDALLRNDLVAFTHRCFKELYPGKLFEPNWHHDAVAYRLAVTAVTGELGSVLNQLAAQRLC